MKPSDADVFEQIHDLVCAQAEGRLTPAQAARLEALVLTSDEARRIYVSYVRESASLRWWAGVEEAMGGDWKKDGAAAHPVAQQAIKSKDGRLAAQPQSPGPTVAPKALLRIAGLRRRWIGVAAALLLGLGIAVLVLQPRPKPVATIASALAAQWGDGAQPRADGILISGEYSLTAGGVRISLAQGAEVILTAPSRFRLESPNSIFLYTGRLTAQVGQEAVGFTVHTASATIVDLGTQFGVSVDNAGTQVQVVRGAVQVQPKSGGLPTRLVAGDGALIAVGATAVRSVPFQATAFTNELVLIDLVDVVAGGDGTQEHRNAGINPLDGSVESSEPTLEERSRDVADGKFHACPSRPLVAGVFVPHGGAAVQIDPAGHTYSAFVAGPQPRTYYWLWAGGPVPLNEPNFHTTAYPTTIGPVDYNSPGHGLLFMHANKGVTFDLAAIRLAHLKRRFTRFRCIAVNTSGSRPERDSASQKCDFLVFVDGNLLAEKSGILRNDPPFQISVPIDPTAHYLTLVSADGGDTSDLDWVTLGDPRLE